MSLLAKLKEKFERNRVKRRLKAALRRISRPARVIPPKETQND